MIQKTALSSFILALRYPFIGKGWFTRILPLVFVLIPIVGQMILLGYGMEVARDVYVGKSDLPPIYWVKALRDGEVFVFTGLLYLIPLLALVPIILSVGMNQSSPTTAGTTSISRVFLTISITLVVSVVVGQLRIQSKTVGNAIAGVLGIAFIITLASTFSDMSSIRANSVTFGNLNSIGILLIFVLAAVVILLVITLQIGGVRYALL